MLQKGNRALCQAIINQYIRSVQKKGVLSMYLRPSSLDGPFYPGSSDVELIVIIEDDSSLPMLAKQYHEWRNIIPFIGFVHFTTLPELKRFLMLSPLYESVYPLEGWKLLFGEDLRGWIHPRAERKVLDYQLVLHQYRKLMGTWYHKRLINRHFTRDFFRFSTIIQKHLSWVAGDGRQDVNALPLHQNDQNHLQNGKDHAFWGDPSVVVENELFHILSHILSLSLPQQKQDCPLKGPAKASMMKLSSVVKKSPFQSAIIHQCRDNAYLYLTLDEAGKGVLHAALEWVSHRSFPYEPIIISRRLLSFIAGRGGFSCPYDMNTFKEGVVIKGSFSFHQPAEELLIRKAKEDLLVRRLLICKTISFDAGSSAMAAQKKDELSWINQTREYLGLAKINPPQNDWYAWIKKGIEEAVLACDAKLSPRQRKKQRPKDK